LRNEKVLAQRHKRANDSSEITGRSTSEKRLIHTLLEIAPEPPSEPEVPLWRDDVPFHGCPDPVE